MLSGGKNTMVFVNNFYFNKVSEIYYLVLENKFAKFCVQSLSWEDPLEKGMTTYSSILAWRIPWTL